jgi:pyruvate dehydrogenase E2 component (dihydrolipoamide acetyltransferase)
MPTVVKMPKWGLTMRQGRVVDWLRREGAPVAEGEPLFTVETDKIAADVEAPASGVLRKIVAEAGSDVPVSAAVAVIASPGESLSDDELAALLASRAAGPGDADGAGAQGRRIAREARSAARGSDGRILASPAARKRALELGLELASVAATGPGGRVTLDDVEAAVLERSVLHEGDVGIGDGLALHYLLAGPADARPPVLLLHGLGGSINGWQTVLATLAERHCVCALDLLGHGASTKPPPAQADYSVRGLAAGVALALEALELVPAVVVGHSLGGAIGLQLALEHPGTVRQLVLVAGAGLGPEINAELLDRIESEPSREEARALLELFFHDRRGVVPGGIEELYQARMLPGASAALRAAAAASLGREGQRVDFRPRLGELSIPVALVWGAHDRVIPVHHAAPAAAALGGAPVAIVENAGHVPHLESADEFVRAVERLLQPSAG